MPQREEQENENWDAIILKTGPKGLSWHHDVKGDVEGQKG